MKLVLSLLCASLVTVSAWAQSSAGGAAKSAPSAGKKAEPVKIEGIEVARSVGGFLGVAVVGGNFKISFYDENKKPVRGDVVRAMLRWDPKGKLGREQAVLNPTGDGKALVSPKVVHPPYAFKLIITLMKVTAESAEPVAAETYVIDFRA